MDPDLVGFSSAAEAFVAEQLVASVVVEVAETVGIVQAVVLQLLLVQLHLHLPCSFSPLRKENNNNITFSKCRFHHKIFFQFPAPLTILSHC